MGTSRVGHRMLALFFLSLLLLSSYSCASSPFSLSLSLPVFFFLFSFLTRLLACSAPLGGGLFRSAAPPLKLWVDDCDPRRRRKKKLQYLQELQEDQ